MLLIIEFLPVSRFFLPLSSICPPHHHIYHVRFVECQSAFSVYTVSVLKLAASRIASHCFTQYLCTMSFISLFICAVLLRMSGGQLVREDSNGSISQELSGTSETTDGTSRVPKIKVGAGNTVLAEMKARQDKRTSSPQQVSICEIFRFCTAVLKEIRVFWDVMPCQLVPGAECLHVNLLAPELFF